MITLSLAIGIYILDAGCEYYEIIVIKELNWKQRISIEKAMCSQFFLKKIEAFSFDMNHSSMALIGEYISCFV